MYVGFTKPHKKYFPVFKNKKRKINTYNKDWDQKYPLMCQNFVRKIRRTKFLQQSIYFIELFSDGMPFFLIENFIPINFHNIQSWIDLHKLSHKIFNRIFFSIWIQCWYQIKHSEGVHNQKHNLVPEIFTILSSTEKTQSSQNWDGNFRRYCEVVHTSVKSKKWYSIVMDWTFIICQCFYCINELHICNLSLHNFCQILNEMIEWNW